ncbi:hypothetical protein RRF57_002305 [Xylaria bambusicola]|uniref:Uncharacterized protein n=1 Tax=Xylaria bambusicola TaxID=326684 RepID=A0AAN7U6R4_9PEZI
MTRELLKASGSLASVMILFVSSIASGAIIAVSTAVISVAASIAPGRSPWSFSYVRLDVDDGRTASVNNGVFIAMSPVLVGTSALVLMMSRASTYGTYASDDFHL